MAADAQCMPGDGFFVLCFFCLLPLSLVGSRGGDLEIAEPELRLYTLIQIIIHKKINDQLFMVHQLQVITVKLWLTGHVT